MKENYVTKSWGWELWFANNKNYCGKLLHVFHGSWSSNGKFHYHKIKDETFLIISGSLILDYADEDDNIHSITLNEEQSFRVSPGMKHRFTAATHANCKFIEASTTHKDSDSYRVLWNERTKKWVE